MKRDRGTNEETKNIYPRPISIANLFHTTPIVCWTGGGTPLIPIKKGGNSELTSIGDILTG